MYRKFMSTILILLLAGFSVHAQWSNDPLVNTIVNNMSGSQATPLIAYDNAGNFYVGFFSNEAGNYNVRLQYYNFSGVAQWTSGGILVSGHPQNSSLTPWDLITDNAGNCILAFTDVRTGDGNVYAYAISPAGTFLWGADGIALTTGSDYVVLPNLAATSTNHIIAAWQHTGVNYREIRMQKITPAGAVLWGSTGITYQSGSYHFTAPRMLGVESDQYLMVFYKETGNFPAITRSIYAQKFNASGTAVWSSETLVTNSNGISPWAYFPTIASDGANGVIVAWTDDRNGDNNINAAVNRILSDGSSSWPANGSEVNNINTNSDQNPQILGVNTSDEVLVSWSKKNSSQSQTAIAGQKFSSAGIPQWTNAGIEFIAMSPDVSGTIGGAVFGGTNALIVYDEYVSSTAYQHIKALAVDNSGSMIWSPTTSLMAGRTTSKVHTTLTGMINDQLVATWEEAGADIYMQNIYDDGSIGDPPIGTDASLSDLTVNGTTVDGFSPDIYSYTVPIPTGDPLPVTGATTNDPAATLNITQAVSVPGTATVLVTAEDGSTQLTYTVNFYVAGDDATLSDLTVDGTTIPGFSPTVYSYDYAVANGDPIPVVGATPTDPNASLLITQATGLPGTATVLVTSEDGLNTNTYTVNFLYTPGTDATLSDLIVGSETIEGFDPQVLDYTYAVIYNNSAPWVTGIPNDPLASVMHTQCTSIPGDAILEVTAEDGVTTLTYTVHFYYLPYDASLSDLTVDGSTIDGFDPNVLSYQYVVDEGAPIPVVDGTPTDPLASLTITQATEIPGEALLHVLAQDSVNELTYTVFFYTLASDPTLSDLTLDGETVAGFDPLVTYYEADVPEGNDIPLIDGTPNDPLASMLITQAPAVPGDGFILVTAQDGITQLTYTVHFNLITGVSHPETTTVQFSPNPVTDQIQLSGLMNSQYLEIRNLLGEIVFSGKVSNQQTIAVSDWPDGIYIATISLPDGGRRRVKLVKK